MGSLSYTIKIAMLNADTPVPNVAAKFKTYGDVFDHLLNEAASRVAPYATIKSTNFDVVRGEYPESAAAYDALLVTGSASSAYEDAAWIHKLNGYLAAVYREIPQIKIFGSCFGHQILCQSLLGEFGCRVEKASNGWELGVHEIAFGDEFRKRFPASQRNQHLAAPLPETMRLQLIHADRVHIPEGGLPQPWIPLGASKHCAVQGVLEPGRVLTYQGHFEFDRFINSETVKVFGKEWDPTFYQNAMDSIDADDDSKAAAEMVVKFLL